jgi:hypothetical protein
MAVARLAPSAAEKRSTAPASTGATPQYGMVRGPGPAGLRRLTRRRGRSAWRP